MMLDVQKSYNSLLSPTGQQRDEEWFDDLDHNVYSFKRRIHSWIKDAEAERQAQLSSKQSVSTKLPLKVGHQEDQVAKLTADLQERKEHLKRESRRQS